jgi:acyl dehydratase
MSLDVAALTGKENFFEDFNTGDVYEHARGKTMEALENVLITNLVLNTAQAHFNEDAAERFVAQKHRITFGGVTASLVIGLAMQDTGEQAVEEIGLDKVRFRVPVVHGDTLYAFTEVLGKNDSAEVCRGHKDVGEVHFKHYGVNQRGETVFEGERRVLIKKRTFSTSGLAYEESEEAVVAAVVVAEEVVSTAAPAKKLARPVKRKGSPAKVAGRSAKAKTVKPAKMLKPARVAKPSKAAKPTKSVTKALRPKKRPR